MRASRTLITQASANERERRCWNRLRIRIGKASAGDGGDGARGGVGGGAVPFPGPDRVLGSDSDCASSDARRALGAHR